VASGQRALLLASSCRRVVVVNFSDVADSCTHTRKKNCPAGTTCTLIVVDLALEYYVVLNMYR